MNSHSFAAPCLLLSSLLASTTFAQDNSLSQAITGGTLLLNLRPRYEYVDQDTRAEDANAFTLRTLLGWRTLPWQHLSLTAEGINVTHLGTQRFNDNAANTSPYPLVADPVDTDINQLYVDYTGPSNTTLRVGRQSIKLDNVRFVGNVEFRQVMQVFNAVTLDYQGIEGLRLYAGYLSRQKTTAGTQRATHTPIINARYTFAPGEQVIAYGYWQNQPVTGQVTGFADNSNRILGVRLDGAHPLVTEWKLLYTAEFARQDDYAGGDARIDAGYHRLGAGAQWRDSYARVDHEVLGSNGGLYGFQTPLGTNHLFQGWADQLLTTPKQGVRDLFVTVGTKLGTFALTGEAHRFDAEYGNLDFGKELDAAVSYTTAIKGLSAKIEYADYRAGDTATGKLDTRKIWLTATYTY